MSSRVQNEEFRMSHQDEIDICSLQKASHDVSQFPGGQVQRALSRLGINISVTSSGSPSRTNNKIVTTLPFRLCISKGRADSVMRLSNWKHNGGKSRPCFDALTTSHVVPTWAVLLLFELHPDLFPFSMFHLLSQHTRSVVFHNIHVPPTHISLPTPLTMDHVETLRVAISVLKRAAVFLLIVGPFQHLRPFAFSAGSYLVLTYEFFSPENSFQYPDITLVWAIAYCFILRLAFGVLDDWLGRRPFMESLTWRQLLRGPFPWTDNKDNWRGRQGET